MAELNNGIAVYDQRKNGLYEVTALFNGKPDVVFQSYKRSEVVAYCHSNGMRVVTKKAYNAALDASFRKIHSRKPFHIKDWKLGTVY